MPIVLILCTIGAFAANNRMFDAQSILFFGVLGYVMSKVQLPIAPFILSFILGELVETNLRRGLQFTNGSFLAFFQSPIAAGFMLIAIAFIVWTVIKNILAMKKSKVA